MSRFTRAEIEYLQSQRLGRLATTNEKGDLHVVPVGFRYNPLEDTIDIGGFNLAGSKDVKYPKSWFSRTCRAQLGSFWFVKNCRKN